MLYTTVPTVFFSEQRVIFLTLCTSYVHLLNCTHVVPHQAQQTLQTHYTGPHNCGGIQSSCPGKNSHLTWLSIQLMRIMDSHYSSYLGIYSTEHITLQKRNLDFVCSDWSATVLFFYSDVDAIRGVIIQQHFTVYILQTIETQQKFCEIYQPKADGSDYSLIPNIHILYTYKTHKPTYWKLWSSLCVTTLLVAMIFMPFFPPNHLSLGWILLHKTSTSTWGYHTLWPLSQDSTLSLYGCPAFSEWVERSFAMTLGKLTMYDPWNRP